MTILRTEKAGQVFDSKVLDLVKEFSDDEYVVVLKVWNFGIGLKWKRWKIILTCAWNVMFHC